MRLSYFCIFFFFTLNVLAKENIDQKLDGYIKQFSLSPMQSIRPKNEALFRLGQKLFFDQNISGNRNISCADCHHPKTMTGDALPLAIGEGALGIETESSHRMQGSGVMLARNTPALFNLDHVNVMFWDGRVSRDPVTGALETPEPKLNGLNPELHEIAIELDSALAAQTIFPMTNHEEMSGQPGSNEIANAQDQVEMWERIVARTKEDVDYVQYYQNLFPGKKINIGHLGKALAEFIRVQFDFADTPYDRYLKGDKKALSETEKIGMEIFFGKGQCGQCHNGEHLSNFEFKNIGVPQIGPGKVDGDDPGRYLIDSKDEHYYGFKTPALRNVALTAPYMHDGAFKTLAQVIEHYDNVKDSLREYKLVNNFVNYTTLFADHLHNRDDYRIMVLADNLTPNLGFEEWEEKALAEFLSTSLTDVQFNQMEIEQNYNTLVRFDLSQDAFLRMTANLPDETVNYQSEYFYFDVFVGGGYFLRELQKPIKIYLVKNKNDAKFFIRENLKQNASASEGVVAGFNFESIDSTVLNMSNANKIAKSMQDIFQTIYKSFGENGDGNLELSEKDFIKSAVIDLSSMIHSQNLAGEVKISDKTNIPRSELFYVPTSLNTKDVFEVEYKILGKNCIFTFLHSYLYDEHGFKKETWALEVKTEKVLKAELSTFSSALVKKVKELGLMSDDLQGVNPSPSKLTERILNEIFAK